MHGHNDESRIKVYEKAAEVHAALMHGHVGSANAGTACSVPQRFTRL